MPCLPIGILAGCHRDSRVALESRRSPESLQLHCWFCKSISHLRNCVMFYPFFFFFLSTNRGQPKYTGCSLCLRGSIQPLTDTDVSIPIPPDQAPQCRGMGPQPRILQGKGARQAPKADGLGNNTLGLLLVKNWPPAAFIASPALTCGNI